MPSRTRTQAKQPARRSVNEAEELYYSLRRLVRRHGIDEEQQVCGFGVTRSECYALEILSRNGPQRVVDLAAALGTNKSTASRIAAALETKGLVRKATVRSDGRALTLRVTREGERRYRQLYENSVACYQGILERWAPADRSAALAILDALGAEPAQPLPSARVKTSKR